MHRPLCLLISVLLAASLLLVACSEEDTEPPPPEVIISPGIPDGAVSVDREPLLTWQSRGDTAGLAGYRVRLDTLRPPQQAFDAGRDTSWQAPELRALHRYWWNVAAIDTAGQVRDQSATWSFTTAFVLTGIQPPDGAVDVPTVAILSWSPSKRLESRVDHYLVRFGTDPDFLELVYEGTRTWLIQPGLEPGTTYWWYVVAVDADGLAHTDGPWSFTVGDVAANQPTVTAMLDGEPFAQDDTVAYGSAFTVSWTATTPNVGLFPPEDVARLDTLPPTDDGILGFQWAATDGQEPLVWRPRVFDPDLGDSVATFGPVQSLTFLNDGSGEDLFHRVLPGLDLRINAVDLAGAEVPAEARDRDIIVNYDPDTHLLLGETDPIYDDPHTYPYYEVFHGPEAGTYPFDPTDDEPDTIPDGARVVMKALGWDDPRDQYVGDANEVRFQGQFIAEQRFHGGAWFSFATGYAGTHRTAAWTPPEPGGVAADTLSFLAGPFHYQALMRSVDEHDRRDGTPDTLRFVGNHPPCVQCVELTSPRQDLHPPMTTYEDPCLLASCLEETARLVASHDPQPADADQLLPVIDGLLWANLTTGDVTFTDPQDDDYLAVFARYFEMMAYLSGKDHPREHWAPGEAERRIAAWRYQIDYAGDPDNLLADGPGIDDLAAVTGLDITANDTTAALFIKASGVWGMRVRVAVPGILIESGPRAYWDWLLDLTGAPPRPPDDPTWFEDPRVVEARRAWDLTTVQLSPGTVRVIAQDYTLCAYDFQRSMYHYFAGARVPEIHGRRCEPGAYDTEDVQEAGALELELFAQESLSHGGEPVARPFDIAVEYGGAEPGIFEGGPPPDWP